MNRRAYRVEGRVQGVGFRWFVRKAASELGLRGTVRNAPEGHVEVVAEGTGEALETLERALREGPRTAEVTGVTVVPTPDGDLPDAFGIVR